MQEIWKDVEGYEGLYQVSNLGRIKSYVKCIAHSNVPRILKPLKNRQGYLRVELTKNGQRKHAFIHRLVASTFISNVENKPSVNHIDGNKSNNKVSNLEWCTYSENMRHAYDTGLKVCKCGKEHHNHAVVNQYDTQGNFIKTWYGFHEIDRVLGYDYRNIAACCNKKQRTAYGFIWRYKDDTSPMFKDKKDKPRNKKRVVCLTSGKTYSSLSEAARETGANTSQISLVCSGERKQTKGMIFQYEQDDI